MQVAEHSTQNRTLGTFVLLASVLLGVQLVVALPITLHIWKAAFRPGALSWDRADAVTIPTFLLLQSAIGALFLCRLRRSCNYLVHAGKGVLVALGSFLIAALLGFFILSYSYEPVAWDTPFMFFVTIFFLGHRIPLLGVVLGGFVATTLQWLRN